MAYRSTEKTEAHRAKIRLRILDAAQARVLAGGFSNVSVNLVAADAGIATGTMYRHFKGKTELCTELFRSASQYEVDLVQKGVEGKGEPRLRLQHTTQMFVSRAVKGRHLAYALIAEPLDPALEHERLRFRQAYAELFQKLVEEGIAYGDFVLQNPAITATALVGVMAEALVGPLAPSSDALSEQQQKMLTSEISQFCLRAVGSQRI